MQQDLHTSHASATPSANASWQTLLHDFPGAGGPEAIKLLTDGRVLAQQYQTGNWYALTPDSSGSYVNGTWTAQPLTTMPNGYKPEYYASAILPDGRMIVEGGEYNNANKTTETNLGAIYNPTTNTWQTVNPPTGWDHIGDAPSTVLADGKFMMGNGWSAGGANPTTAILNPSTLTWSDSGTGKADSTTEEGFALLPDGSVLTIDTENGNHTEVYKEQPSGAWSSAGDTLHSLATNVWAPCCVAEIGAHVLRPDGTVFATGATGHNALYNTAKSTWSSPPDFPTLAGQQFDAADAPAAVLPDGHVLVGASPGTGAPPEHFFDFDGTNLTQVADSPNAPNVAAAYTYFLVLPTGQILSRQGGSLAIYTDPGSPLAAWKPSIISVPGTLNVNGTYTLTGSQLNGRTEACGYGDDFQCGTNFPLVRITNNASGHVTYARTFGMTSSSVTPNVQSSTQFSLPGNVELGLSRLQVVANGIASSPVTVDVRPGIWRHLLTRSGRQAFAFNEDGREELFAVGGDGTLQTAYQVSSGGWSPLVSLGGTLRDAPAQPIGVGENQDQRLAVYAIGLDGYLYWKYQGAPNGVFGSTWTQIGGAGPWPAYATPTVGYDADGRQELYLVGTDGHVWTTTQTAANSTTWSSWTSLGGTWGATKVPTVGTNADGRQELYIVGPDKQLYTKAQSTVNGAFASTWTSLYGSWPADPAVGINADGRQQVYLVGDDASLWTKAQVAPNSGTWDNSWTSLGDGAFRQRGVPGLGVNADERQQVFVLGSDGAVYTKAQTSPSGSFAASWTELYGNAPDGVVVGLYGETQNLFEVSPNHTLYLDPQNSANSANFGGWQALDGPLPVSTPDAPTLTGIRAGNGWVAVAWDAPSSAGDTPISSYLVTSFPGGQTMTVPKDALRAVLPVPNGQAQTVHVQAVNDSGPGDESNPSSSFTPSASTLNVTTQYDAFTNTRLLKNAAYFGQTPVDAQRTSVAIIAYIVGIVNNPDMTPITPPAVSGPNSYTTPWSATEQGPLVSVMRQYGLKPNEAQSFCVQVVGYLLALGGH